MQYIGSNWFRFAALTEVFSVARAVLPPSAKLRVRGKYWNGDFRPGFEAATKADSEVLRQLGVEVYPCVPFGDIVRRMGDATVTPVLVRPLLGALGFLTPRMFETVTARTIPVYREEDSYISELYHDDRYFCLGKTHAKMHDVFKGEEQLDRILEEVRQRIQRDYSYVALLTRLRDLLS
jgi:hypothetical protein